MKGIKRKGIEWKGIKEKRKTRKGIRMKLRWEELGLKRFKGILKGFKLGECEWEEYKGPGVREWDTCNVHVQCTYIYEATLPINFKGGGRNWPGHPFSLKFCRY